MKSRGSLGGARLGTPMGLSLALHAAVVGLLIVRRPSAPPVLPPVYRVDLVAAPAGPRAPGIVPPKPQPIQPAAEPAPIPPRAQQVRPREMPPPAKPKARPERRTPPAPATPVPREETKVTPAEQPPVAGGGPEGGAGTDVVTVRTEGIEFPYPGYLENIVRQIAMNFDPPKHVSARAEVSFLIHRDGSISNLQFVTRSNVFKFDLEAQGAVEAAGNSRSFGPLPNGFPDDVLPVTFSFDPRVLR